MAGTSFFGPRQYVAVGTKALLNNTNHQGSCCSASGWNLNTSCIAKIHVPDSVANLQNGHFSRDCSVNIAITPNETFLHHWQYDQAQNDRK